MSNSDLIMESLDEIYPHAYCDDCLATELNIRPRQQINQLGNKLSIDGKIIRQKGICSLCKKQKITNSITRNPSPAQEKKAKSTQESATTHVMSSQSPPYQPINIEDLRTQIVRICRRIWDENKKENPPQSISAVITTLRNESILPSHQANMMQTICGLRNLYVYENMELGQREMTIARNAWDIILEWWNKKAK